MFFVTNNSPNVGCVPRTKWLESFRYCCQFGAWYAHPTATETQSAVRAGIGQGDTESRANAEVNDFRQPENAETVSSNDDNEAQTRLEQAIAEQNANNELRYSLNESTTSSFAKAVDEIANGKAVSTGQIKYIKIGTTPDVLKMLGLPDTQFSISEAVIEKAMGENLNVPIGKYAHIHNLTASDLKAIPAQVNNPIAVFKSDSHSSNPNGFVVLTDLMETKTKDNSQAPVIVALNIKPKKRGLELINISSAYGKQKNWFINQFENNALFVDTAKGQNFLNTHNLQLGWDFTSGSALSGRNIKTESDLSQYKQQNTTQNSRVSEPLQSSDRATPQQIAAYKTAISGSLKNHAHLINVVSRDDLVRPENAEKLQGVEGFYNPSNGQITLIAESLHSPAHAQFVAWHELAHRKIDVSGAKDWQSAIAQAAKHETVRKLADKIQEQRKNTDDPAATNRAIAHEEAIAELYAAHETGDYAALKAKYDIKIPRAIQNNLGGFLARLGDKLANIVKRVLGLNMDNHAQVYDLLRDLSRADVSGSLKFSRGTTKDQIAQFAQTGKIEQDLGLIEALKNDRTAEYLSGKKSSLKTTAFLFDI